jgi:hypothetical protein
VSRPGTTVHSGPTTELREDQVLRDPLLALQPRHVTITLRREDFWQGCAIPCSAVAQQRYKIIHNGVALGGEESVSGVTGGSGPSSQPGEPTHAHLHHRQ